MSRTRLDLHAVAFDEPWNAGFNIRQPAWPFEHLAQSPRCDPGATLEPDIEIGLIEPYPTMAVDTLCASIQSFRPAFFHIDIDYLAAKRAGTLETLQADLARVRLLSSRERSLWNHYLGLRGGHRGDVRAQRADAARRYSAGRDSRRPILARSIDRAVVERGRRAGSSPDSTDGAAGRLRVTLGTVANGQEFTLIERRR